MNRSRRARSPPFVGGGGGGFDPGMMGHPRVPQDPYDDPFYPPHPADGLPYDGPPMMPGAGPPQYMDPAAAQHHHHHQHPQAYPPGFRENHRLPPSYQRPPSAQLYPPQQPHPAAQNAATPGYPAAPYKILCITNLNSKVEDLPLKDALKDNFSHYRDISVTICHDNGERLAYIYFKSYEEAREARHSKSKTILFDKHIEIEPIYEPRSSPVASPPPSAPAPPMAAPMPYPSRRRSITPPEYYDHPSEPQTMDYARRSMHPMAYQRSGGVSPPPGFPEPILPPHHYPSHRQTSPGPAPYGRYYMGPSHPANPQSPYSSPPRDPYGRPYPPPGMPYPGPYQGSPYAREPRERPSYDDHLARGPHCDPYYPPMDARDYPPQPGYPTSRSPLVQPSSSHHYTSGPHDMPGPGYPPARYSSPPRYGGHPRYTSREFRREKFGIDHGGPGDGKPSRVLFITDIDPSKTEPELRNIFDPFGSIEEIEVRKISLETASAIIKFSSMDCAYKAKTALHGKYLGEVKCRILYGKVSASRRLWIGGFGPNTTMARLEDEFGRYGEIVSLDYISGRPYAYIEYESANQAQFATQHLRGTFVAEAERRIRIEYVDPVKNDKNNTDKQQQTATVTRQSPDTDTRSRLSGAHEPNSPQSRSIKRRSISPTDAGKISNNNNNKRLATQIYEESPKSTSLCDDNKFKSTPNLGLSEDSNLTQNDSTSLGNESRSNISRHECPEERLAQSRSIRDIVDCCSVSWFGKLILRNFTFTSKMFLFKGNKSVIERYITKLNGENGNQCPLLPITQRWRLHSQSKLEEVKRRMQSSNLAMILILPKVDQQSPSTSVSSPAGFKTPMSTPSNQGTVSGTTPLAKQNGEQQGETTPDNRSADTSANSEGSSSPSQLKPLKNLIGYLEQKDAAGVISLEPLDNQASAEDSKESTKLYAIPPGNLALSLLQERFPKLKPEGKEEYLLGLIVSGVCETTSKQTP